MLKYSVPDNKGEKVYLFIPESFYFPERTSLLKDQDRPKFEVKTRYAGRVLIESVTMLTKRV